MKDLLVIIGIILVSAALLTAVLSAFFRFKSRLRRVSEKKTVLHISVPKSQLS